MPQSLTITGRSSTITNVFASAIVPVVNPTYEQVVAVLKILGMAPDSVVCSYCGETSSEWDHFHPLIHDKKPTGHWSSIRNLVPACGKCNQSKGGKPWEMWIQSAASQARRCQTNPGFVLRIKRLQAYEEWARDTPYDFSALVGEDLWLQYQKELGLVLRAMARAQAVADQVKIKLREKFDSLRPFEVTE